MRVQDLDDLAPPHADETSLVRVRGRGHRLRKRRRATLGAGVALIAVALAAVGATVERRHDASPTLSVQPKSVAPAVPTPTNEPIPSPTSKPAAVASTVPSSVAFADQNDGVGLRFSCAVPPAGDPVCAFVVVVSHDAGHTWARVGGVSDIVYAGWRGYPDIELAADGPNVWIYGTRTFASHDGGHSFEDQHLPGIVSALVPRGDTVWATLQPCALCPTDTLVSAPLNGGAWKSLSSFPNVGDPYVELLRPSAAVAYVVGLDTHTALYRSADGGHTWQAAALPPRPPSSLQTNTVTIAAFGAHEIWMLSGGDAATQNQQKALYRSEDGGTHWTLVADTRASTASKIGHLPLRGLGLTLTVETPQRIWIPLDRGPFVGSVDGGHRWFDTLVSSHVSQVMFIDGIGWAWNGDISYRTTDGQRWKRILP